MGKVPIGIIGYGNFGRFLHQAWQDVEEAEVTAVSKRSLAVNSLNGVKVYNDWQRLVEDPEIELVVITTPPADHAEMASAAMYSGKHVLIEKPLGLTTNQAEKLIEIRDRTNRAAGVNHLLRFNPIIEAVVNLTGAGHLGTLQRAIVENYAGDTGLPPDHWFWNKKVSGGILIEHGVHFIDIINQLTSETPRKVTALSSWRNEAQEDRVLANILYSEGLIATHFHLFSGPSAFESTAIRLCYTKARIDLWGWVPLKGRVTVLGGSKWEHILSPFPNLEIKKEAESGKGTDSIITATFGLRQSKQDLYARCAQELLRDLLKKIENPQHELRVPLEDGLLALKIAEEGANLLE